MSRSRMAFQIFVGMTLAAFGGMPPSLAAGPPPPVQPIIELSSMPLPLPAMALSKNRQPSPSDPLSIPLQDADHEIRQIAYWHRWDQEWFDDVVVAIVRRSCGDELSTLHPRVQQAYANTIAFQISTSLSPEVQNGLGHPNWIKTREEQVAAVAKSPAEWQAQLSDRLSPLLPSGENWVVDVADPTLNVIYTAAKFDLMSDLEPMPSLFPAVNGLACGQSTPEPAMLQNTAPKYTAPQEEPTPRRGSVGIAIGNAAGAIAFRQATPGPKR